MSRTAFTARFPDDAACARHLFEKRWPNGFVCPKCQSAKAWALEAKPFTYECAACGRQTSVTAGTIFHRSHLSLLTWFLAIYAIASHSNGISALQLQAQLGLGSYKTAWLMLQKLRRAMVDPDRSLLEDLVELDESDIPYRTKADPIAGGQGRSAIGKLHFIGAIELSPDGNPRRIRLAPLDDFSAPCIGAFVAGAVKPGATILSDGFSAYRGLKGYNHQPKVVGKMAAHVVLPWKAILSPPPLPSPTQLDSSLWKPTTAGRPSRPNANFGPKHQALIDVGMPASNAQTQDMAGSIFFGFNTNPQKILAKSRPIRAETAGESPLLLPTKRRPLPLPIRSTRIHKSRPD